MEKFDPKIHTVSKKRLIQGWVVVLLIIGSILFFFLKKWIYGIILLLIAIWLFRLAAKHHRAEVEINKQIRKTEGIKKLE